MLSTNSDGTSTGSEAGVGALEDTVDLAGRAAEGKVSVGGVTQQPAGLDETVVSDKADRR